MNKYELINNGSYKKFLQKKKEFYKLGLDVRDKELYRIEFGEDVEELFKIYESSRQRKKRNRDDILRWIFVIKNTAKYKDCKMVFGTLTFNDTVLKTTMKKTRRRYVATFLSEETLHYMANIDYSDAGREHYHFIAIIEKPMNLSKWNWRQNVEIIDLNDITKIVSYVLKLNNHSFKESTRQERICKDKNVNSRVDEFCEEIFDREFKIFKNEFNHKLSLFYM